MALLKKSKKSKRASKKLKKKQKNRSKSGSAASIDPKAIDSDWWDSFRHKNSSSTEASIPSDEEGAFKYFFRVKKTFEYICSLVMEDLISRPPSGLINIDGRLLSVEKQVAIALRRSCQSSSSKAYNY